MPQPSLFQSDPEPAAYPGEPAVWVKQVVIVPKRELGVTPIRDISFRLGLNVINARLPSDPDTTAFGHNVGKTLLVRLIRYCLGDEQYAGSRVRSRIRAVSGEAAVIAVLRVRNADWAVCRSLASAKQSCCLQTTDRHDLLAEAGAFLPYSDFEKALHALRPTELDHVRVGRTDRVPAWTDLLGWLIRDQRCRYTSHNTWRHKDDDSDPDVLRDTDANLVSRVVLNLFDREEYDATNDMDAARTKLRQTQGQLDDLRQQQAQMVKLLAEEAEIIADFGEGEIAHAAIRSAIEDRKRSFVEQISRLPEAKAVADAEADLVVRRQRRDKTEGGLEQRQRDLKRLQGELELAQKPDEKEALAAQRHKLSCGLGECRYLVNDPKYPDPTREDRINEKKEVIEQTEREIAAITAEHDQHKAAVRSAETAVAVAEAKFANAAGESRQAVSQCDFLLKRFQKYVTSSATRDQLERDRQSTEAALKELEKRREARADTRTRQLVRLNHCFQEVMNGLIRRSGGKLSLDLKSGIASNPEASSGEAMGSAGRVVGFDLVSLVASVDGFGSHPRFLIHDSPREADLNELIYRNLFQFVLKLETRFPDHQPAFQYILTTTSPPPDFIRGEYIRETLHDESPDGRLLRFEFE